MIAAAEKETSRFVAAVIYFIYTLFCRYLNPKLEYYQLKYCCIHGGRKFKFEGKGIRDNLLVELSHSVIYNCNRTFRQNCPMHITINVDFTGNYLTVGDVCYEHNHPVSEVYK